MVATYTQLLAERYRGQLDENADKYVHYAVDGALRMQALVQDLLRFSRVGRRDPDLQNTDCNAVVATAVRNLETAIAESGTQVLDERLPTLVADGSQLAQVFQNLIGKWHRVPRGRGAGHTNWGAAERPAMGVHGRRQRHRHCARACRGHLCES